MSSSIKRLKFKEEWEANEPMSKRHVGILETKNS